MLPKSVIYYHLIPGMRGALFIFPRSVLAHDVFYDLISNAGYAIYSRHDLRDNFWLLHIRYSLSIYLPNLSGMRGSFNFICTDPKSPFSTEGRAEPVVKVLVYEILNASHEAKSC
jgi:hypothetical protein